MARSPDHLTLAQFDLLDWISKGCPDGIYEGSSHRVSARGLHNRGLVHITGTGKTWTAKITAEGTRVLTEQGRRVAVVRERERQAEQAQAERVRAQQQLRTRALEVLEATIAAGGVWIWEPAPPQPKRHRSPTIWRGNDWRPMGDDWCTSRPGWTPISGWRSISNRTSSY